MKKESAATHLSPIQLTYKFQMNQSLLQSALDLFPRHLGIIEANIEN